MNLKIHQALPSRLLDPVTPHQPTPRPPRFEIRGITETIQRALATAGLDTQSGPTRGVADTIQQALEAAGLSQRSVAPIGDEVAFDEASREADAPFDDTDGKPTEPASGVEKLVPGKFLDRSFTNDAGTRTYKLYIPANYPAESGEAAAMIVMLHGCTQSPDDFAAGTRMNALADRYGFLVVYPAQAVDANGSRCWNWFRSEDQKRDSGEPALIAGITREVASTYHVDAQRVFVAGMSAGAAMAVTLGALYPDLYVAVGAHSGLPYRAAHDMPSAFAAMKGGAGPTDQPKQSGSTAANCAEASSRTPTIVFHGDYDRTVNARNSVAIVEQVTLAGSDNEGLRRNVQTGTARGGRKYSRTDYIDEANQPIAEHWIVHGAAHAWSGGSPRGSFTDAGGPDASAEMIRFFYSQRREPLTAGSTS